MKGMYRRFVGIVVLVLTAVLLISQVPALAEGGTVEMTQDGEGRVFTVPLDADPRAVLDAYAQMADGDTLAYEQRDGMRVLEAAMADGNLVIEVWPGQALADNQEIIQTAMYALMPGDQLLFHEGVYGRLLPLTAGEGNNPVFAGEPEKSIVVRGYGEGEDRPVIKGDGGEAADLWTINGSYIDVSYLTFTESTAWAIGLTRTSRTPEDIGTITDITIRDCIFDNNSNVSIAANWSNYHYNNILIEGNVFTNANYTYIYIGQADGNSWGDNIVIRNNFFVGNPIDDPNVVGYALQFKRNIYNSLVENNLILNAKGPGIAVYGADTTGYEAPDDVVLPIIIRNNLVLGAGEGINALGGPVIMENNVAFESGYMSIRVQNRTGGDVAVRREMNIQMNTSGFNGYDPYEAACPVDYSNLGPDSTVIVDLGTGSIVDNNVYYTRDADPDNATIQYYVKTLREMTAKPDGFDAYFAEVQAHAGPYTLAELAQKLSLLVDAPTDEQLEDWTAVAAATQALGAIESLDATMPLEDLQAELLAELGGGVAVDLAAYTYLGFGDTELPYYTVVLSKGDAVHTAYVLADITYLQSAREALTAGEILLPHGTVLDAAIVQEKLQSMLDEADISVTVVSVSEPNYTVTLAAGSGELPFVLAEESIFADPLPPTSISVNVNNGTAQVSIYTEGEALEGALVTLVVTNIEEGKHVSALTVTDPYGEATGTAKLVAGETFTFIKPANRVIVQVDLAEDSEYFMAEGEPGAMAYTVTAKAAYGSAFWNPVFKAFDSMTKGDTLVFTDAPYEERGNVNGNIIEARKDADGKLTVEVWPLLGGNPGAHVEALRVCLYALAPGDELLFHEGEYLRLISTTSGNIGFHAGGSVEAPIVIRGYGAGEDRPVFNNTEAGNNIWEIAPSNLDISYLEFTNRNVPARIIAAEKGLTDHNGTSTGMGNVAEANDSVIAKINENVRISDCVFRAIVGTCINTNSSGMEVNNLVIENNSFVEMVTTILYFGQQDGKAPSDGLIVRNNFFDCTRVESRADLSAAVGYCMEMKTGVVGALVENNVILNPFGPGIMIYGDLTTDPNAGASNPNVVRENLVVGGRGPGNLRGTGILVTGGAAEVSGNICIDNANGNILIQDNEAYIMSPIAAQGNTTVGAWAQEIWLNAVSEADASAMAIENNSYYEKALASELLQKQIAAVKALQARPAGMDAFFAEIRTNPGPFTEEQLETLLDLLLGRTLPTLVEQISLDVDALELTQGDTAALVATVGPENASNQTVTWLTSDEAIATVDAAGVVTAVAGGTATITATTIDGPFTASCTVTVEPLPDAEDAGD